MMTRIVTPSMLAEMVTRTLADPSIKGGVDPGGYDTFLVDLADALCQYFDPVESICSAWEQHFRRRPAADVSRPPGAGLSTPDDEQAWSDGPLFLGRWGESYGNPPPRLMQLWQFGVESGYDEEDRAAIEKLAVGETYEPPNGTGHVLERVY